MSSEWQRPESLALPTVWSRFRGLRAMGDGRVPDFWVQCVRPEDDDAVLDIMVKHYVREEEISRVCSMAEDEVAMREILIRWKDRLQQRVSLAAWTDWPDGKSRLVGCNLMYVRFKDEQKQTISTEWGQRAMRAFDTLDARVDVFERFGVSSYLSGVGLSTLPEFRGQGLGLELLRARVPLCRALSLKVTATIFTGPGSQKQSERAGFQLLDEMRYDTYLDDGETILASIKSVGTMQLKVLSFPEHD